MMDESRLRVASAGILLTHLMPQENPIGVMSGPIILRNEGGTYDLRASKWITPGDEASAAMTVAEHDARFVLLVEKQTIFARLLEDDFPLRHRCLLICGDGYPRRSFRKFARLIHDQIRVPFYVLADNDPAGYELFFLIARGALSQHEAARHTIAIPDALYIGLTVKDYDRLELPEWVQITLSDADREQLARLKVYPWLVSDVDWQCEIDALLLRGFKVEMEALCSVSISCLSETYLPERLQAIDHLRLPIFRPL